MGGCRDFVFARPCCPTRDGCKASDGCFNHPGKKQPLEKPLLDCAGLSGECCGQWKTKSPLNPRQQCCTLCMVILALWLLFGSIAQFICFHFATLKCGAAPDDYRFPGGEVSDYGNASYNLMPQNGWLVEQDHTMWGMKFGVLTKKEGPRLVGVWYRTGGPFFSTYTYQDAEYSQPTIYMRASVQSILFGYLDDYVMRCDGQGSSLRLSEGGHYFSNRIRHLLHMNQGF